MQTVIRGPISGARPGGPTQPVTSVNGNRNAANGDFSVNLTVRVSTVSTVSRVLDLAGADAPGGGGLGVADAVDGGVDRRGVERRAVLELQVGPGASARKKVLSWGCSQDSTRPGARRPWAFTRNSVSWIARVAARPWRLPVKCGSKVNGSAKIAAVGVQPHFDRPGRDLREAGPRNPQGARSAGRRGLEKASPG